MRSIDIPQDATPLGIRRAVEAVASGAATRDEVGQRARLSARHVSYHLQAARVLGFVEQRAGWFHLTKLGRKWIATPTSSAADREVFGHAVTSSEHIQHYAPGLLDDGEPSAEAIAERIRHLTTPTVKPETAKRRAQTALRYRAYVLGGADPDVPLFPRLAPRRSERQPGVASRPPEDGRPLRSVQVWNYGCLRAASASLGRFGVLLGANASGKTTFFDALGFVSDALNADLQTALLERVGAFEELLWFGQGDAFAIALELTIPDRLRFGDYTHVRYELEVGRSPPDEAVRILAEVLYLRPEGPPAPALVGIERKTRRGWLRILSLSRKGTAYYHGERTDWKTVFQLSYDKLALSQLPEDQTKFAVALWVRRVLRSGIERLELNSKAMRSPASPLLEDRYRADGSNLPNVARRLEQDDPARFKEWISHLTTALPDVEAVRVVTRPEDKHLYLKVRYQGGAWLPSWRLSDGTLRLLALTLLPYLSVKDRVFLIEEPENGVHPQALEVVYQALSSCYDSQVLVATHSPVFLGIIPPHALLLLKKEAGATTITAGSDHPVLRNWRRDADLGTLFAAGVLT